MADNPQIPLTWYKSYTKWLKDLKIWFPDQRAKWGEVFVKIAEFANGENPQLDEEERKFFLIEEIQEMIEASKITLQERRDNGKKGGRPKKPKETMHNHTVTDIEEDIEEDTEEEIEQEKRISKRNKCVCDNSTAHTQEFFEIPSSYYKYATDDPLVIAMNAHLKEVRTVFPELCKLAIENDAPFKFREIYRNYIHTEKNGSISLTDLHEYNGHIVECIEQMCSNVSNGNLKSGSHFFSTLKNYLNHYKE